MIPSYSDCRCRENFEKIEKRHPPDFTSEDRFRKWGWKVHNLVNSKLNKPQFSWEKFIELYYPTD